MAREDQVALVAEERRTAEEDHLVRMGRQATSGQPEIPDNPETADRF
ncbi:hypothetical protein AAE026_29360 [Bradyrhizobium sp. DN5]